ncbi:four helix bundle protein [Leptobacterium meishanense]|uniref:four helix bundle protein n=1 Tax=Leptobacterium meishanense TaxID=3128904 RepID=UPI0039B787BF
MECLELGVLAEVITCLHKSHRRNYILKKEFDGFYNDCYQLMNMMTAFKKKI